MTNQTLPKWTGLFGSGRRECRSFWDEVMDQVHVRAEGEVKGMKGK